VVDISFGTFLVHIVDDLDITGSTERGDRERLGDTTLEEGRTVRAREYPEGPTDGTNLIGLASIESETAREDIFAHVFFEDFVDGLLDHLSREFRGIFGVSERCLDLIFEHYEGGVEVGFPEVVELCNSLIGDECVNLIFELVVMRFDCERLFAYRMCCMVEGDEVFLCLYKFSDDGMCEFKSSEHRCFVDFLSLRFYHCDGIICSGNREVESGSEELIYCRIKFECPIGKEGDTNSGNRSFKLGHTCELERE